MSGKEFEGDAGAPLPNFNANNIQLTTVAPSLGVASQNQPDYLEYDTHNGRGIVVTMFSNSGVSYLLGTFAGGLVGLQKGISSAPNSKFRVQVNAVLNTTGRYGSKFGNTCGVLSVLFSLYQGLGDNVRNK